MLKYLYIFMVLVGFQNSKYSDMLEKSLDIKLNDSFKSYINAFENKAFEFEFRGDSWTIWNANEAIIENEKLRKLGLIQAKEFVFGINYSDQYIGYNTASETNVETVYIYEEGDAPYNYLSGVCELENQKTYEALVESIDSSNYKTLDISEIEHCVGSLHWFAFNLMTSEYDDYYSPEQNEYALSLYKRCAEKKFAPSATEIADYYYFNDKEYIEETLEWREKAAEWGAEEEKYKLADFIIDYKGDKIDVAINQLEAIADHPDYGERAYSKLYNLYMAGTMVKADYKKGYDYNQKAIDAGSIIAKADRAFFYFSGLGAEKDLKNALLLLNEANEAYFEKHGERKWDTELNFLKSKQKETPDKH